MVGAHLEEIAAQHELYATERQPAIVVGDGKRARAADEAGDGVELVEEAAIELRARTRPSGDILGRTEHMAAHAT